MMAISRKGCGYEFFDHTADVGIRASGATLSELFIRLGQAITELIAEQSELKSRETRPIDLSADNAEALLLAWLQELLYWFSTDRFLAVDYVLKEVTSKSLRGQIRGERFDSPRHEQGREVKAITRHMLQVKREKGIWHGQVIVDI